MIDNENSGVDQNAQRLVDAWSDFEQDPTIENYLRVRKKHSQIDPAFRTLSPGRLQEHDKEQLQLIGVRLGEFLKAIDGDYQAIDQICLAILRHEVERMELLRSGATHAVSRALLASGSFTNELVAMLLEESLQQEWAKTPPSLIMLAKFRLVGDLPETQIAYRATERKDQALRSAAVALFHGDRWSMRKTADAMRIPYETLKNWFNGKSDFDVKVEELTEFYREKGLRYQHPIIMRQTKENS